MKKNLSAFSLIELSIVILIIGVLIAGVTQASRLVRQSKITTAKTLTQSSPVNSIKGLSLWLETSMEGSFKSSEATDKSVLSVWNDLNPQLSITNGFVGSDSPKYVASTSTNSLPGVSTDSGHFNGTRVIDSAFNSYTMFFVVRTTDLSQSNTIFYNGTQEQDGFGVQINENGNVVLVYGVAGSVTGSAKIVANAGSASIICLTIDPSSVDGQLVANPEVFSYINGVADMNGSTGSKTVASSAWVSPTAKISVGAIDGVGQGLKGEIMEVIVFDNVLKKSDRQEIEKYLSKKYAINVIQS